MYAIIATGGKQYRVALEQQIPVEQLDAAVGDTVTLDQVLLVASDDGTICASPSKLTGATVMAEVVAHGRHKKIRILKFKRRKHHMKRMGHRQNFTMLKIKTIKQAS